MKKKSKLKAIGIFFIIIFIIGGIGALFDEPENKAKETQIKSAKKEESEIKLTKKEKVEKFLEKEFENATWIDVEEYNNAFSIQIRYEDYVNVNKFAPEKTKKPKNWSEMKKRVVNASKQLTKKYKIKDMNIVLSTRESGESKAYSLLRVIKNQNFNNEIVYNIFEE